MISAKLLALGALIGGTCATAALSLRPPLLRETAPQSLEARDKEGRLTILPAADGRYRIWRPLGAISPLLVDAAKLELGPEPGRSRVLAARLARLVYGEGWRARLGAPRLRLAFGDDELLEAYLNLAPYGAQIAGVEAASFVYFDKHADQLTLSEALTLSVMPERPLRETLLGWNRADQDARRRAARRLRRSLKAPASDTRRKAGRSTRC